MSRKYFILTAETYPENSVKFLIIEVMMWCPRESWK